MSYVALSPAELAEWTPYKIREFKRRMPQSWKLLQYRIDLAKMCEAERQERRKRTILKHTRFDRQRHCDVLLRTLLARERRRVYLRASHIPAGMSQRIINLTAATVGISLDDILGKSRTKHIANARMTAAWLLRKHTHHSSPEIGRRLGGKDHTSIIYAIKQVNQDLADRGSRFGALIASVEARLSTAY